VNISSQLLFFFSALGVFNGLILASYLYFTKPSVLANRFLAAMLLMVSLRVGKSVWFYFSPDLAKAFLQLGLSACLLIGPFLYFYTAAMTQNIKSRLIPWQWHLSGLLILIVLIGAIYPYPSHVQMWGTIFYKVINWSWLVYIVLSFVMVKPIVLQLKQKQTLSQGQKLLLTVFTGVFIVWLAYFTSSYTSYIAGALSFSFCLYLSILIFIQQYKQKKQIKYKDKKIDNSVAADLSDKINQLMTEELMHRNANLTLPMLAKKVGVSVPQLSQYLNDNLNISFNNFINQYRIKDAKQLLIAEPNLTMENIAERCGYNSQSTFYNAFKKFEQITPAKYRQKGG